MTLREAAGGTTVRVQYTEAMVRQAAWLFVRRALLYRAWVLGLAALLVAVGAGIGLVTRPRFLAGVFVAVFVLVGAVPVVAWRSQLAHALGRFRKLVPPEADFTFEEAALSVRSNLGTASLPWAGFRACWEGEGFWVLALRTSGFVTLPTEALSAEVMEVVRLKVGG